MNLQKDFRDSQDKRKWYSFPSDQALRRPDPDRRRHRLHRCSAKESLVTLNGESTLFISRADAAGLYETVTGIVLN